MKVRNLFAMSLAALAMTACNNEENGPDGPNGGNFTPGEATYAVFNIKVGDSSNTRAESGAGTGLENAVNKEDEIQNASIYLFEWETETTGRSDVSLSMAAPTGHTGAWDIPSAPIMTTSGKKHIVVVTNLTTAAKTELDAAFGKKGDSGYAKFYAAIAKVTTENPKTLFLTGNQTATNITMLGESDPVLVAGATATEVAAGTKNHFNVYVDRALAKLDLKLGKNGAAYATSMNVEATTLGTTTAAKVGVVSNVKYDVRNISKEQYYLTHKKGTDFIVTPYSDQPSTYWKDLAHCQNAYFPTIKLDGTSTNGFNYSALTAVTDLTGPTATTPDTYRAFLTENTSETAVVGNSSYTALETTYKPLDTHYVSGFTNDNAKGNKVTLTTAGTAGTATSVTGAFSLFNQEYNIAFTGATTATEAAKLEYLETMAAYHTSLIEPSLNDISINDIVFIKGGMITGTASDNIHAVTDYDVTKTITSSENVKAICTYLQTPKTVGGTDYPTTGKPVLYVFVSETKNVDGKLNKITMSAAYFWKPNASANVFALNGGVNFGNLTFGVYKVANEGLTSYYRVNIFDVDKGATHQMRYSVVRNYSYHVGIEKINKIGFPTEIDVTIDPETPLNNNTFVQAHVVINKWVAKSMDTELGQ